MVLKNEAEEAARHEHTMFVSFTAAASVQTNPQGRARLLRLAAGARSNALGWARLSNWLQLRVTLGPTFLLVLVGCNNGGRSTLIVTEEYEPPEKIPVKVIETIVAGENPSGSR